MTNLINFLKLYFYSNAADRVGIRILMIIRLFEFWPLIRTMSVFLKSQGNLTTACLFLLERQHKSINSTGTCKKPSLNFLPYYFNTSKRILTFKNYNNFVSLRQETAQLIQTNMLDFDLLIFEPVGSNVINWTNYGKINMLPWGAHPSENCM